MIKRNKLHKNFNKRYKIYQSSTKTKKSKKRKSSQSAKLSKYKICKRENNWSYNKITIKG